MSWWRSKKRKRERGHHQPGPEQRRQPEEAVAPYQYQEEFSPEPEPQFVPQLQEESEFEDDPAEEALERVHALESRVAQLEEKLHVEPEPEPERKPGGFYSFWSRCCGGFCDIFPCQRGRAQTTPPPSPLPEEIHYRELSPSPVPVHHETVHPVSHQPPRQPSPQPLQEEQPMSPKQKRGMGNPSHRRPSQSHEQQPHQPQQRRVSQQHQEQGGPRDQGPVPRDQGPVPRDLGPVPRGHHDQGHQGQRFDPGQQSQVHSNQAPIRHQSLGTARTNGKGGQQQPKEIEIRQMN